MMVSWEDIEQVRDLVFNGFTREHAAAAVAESQGKGEEYARGLLNALVDEMLEGEKRERAER